jgi:hypothetical protein
VDGFHKRTVPSSLAEASTAESGLNAMARTGAEWPLSTRTPA